MAAAEMEIGKRESRQHPLLGLLVSQALGAFNDNAWKQIVSRAGDDRGGQRAEARSSGRPWRRSSS